MKDVAERAQDEDRPASQWPYSAAPEADLETIRRAHIRAETNIRALGTFVALSGVLALVGGVMWLAVVEEFLADSAVDGLAHQRIATVVSVLVAPAYILAGLWLRRWSVRGRSLFTGLYGANILWQLGDNIWLMRSLDLDGGFVVGSVVMTLGLGALFMSVVWSRRGRMVFTEHYQRVVVPATPHVIYRGRVVWYALAIALVLLMALGLVGSMAIAW
jgi:hypothetical protein